MKKLFLLLLLANVLLPALGRQKEDQKSSTASWMEAAVRGSKAAEEAASFVLKTAGFTEAGITRGSFGASMMSIAAKTGVGRTVVSVCQSVGAAGLGSVGKIIGASLGVFFKAASECRDEDCD